MHCPSTPKGAIGLCLRVSFGASLLIIGIIHYMTIDAFKGMVTDGLGPIEFLGALWAYVLPALMILGGALVAIGMYMEIAAWAVGIALGSVAVGMLLKPMLSAMDLPSVMPYSMNALVYLLIGVFAVKFGSCCGSCSGSCDPNTKK